MIRLGLRLRTLAWIAGVAWLAPSAQAASSIGKPGSGSLDDGSPHLTARFYYASEGSEASTRTIEHPDGSSREIPVFGDENSSVRTNSLGDDQVLFYDYYAPKVRDPLLNLVTVIFYHGGGYQNGAANSVCSYSNLDEWVSKGFHAISIGYRRGWWGDGTGTPGGEGDISSEEGTRFVETTDMALVDAQDAWKHFNSYDFGHGRWFTGQAESHVHADHFASLPAYIAIGNSAGGSLVSRTVHTQAYPAPMWVMGAIVGFGTHSVDEPVLASHSSVPTIVVTGLFDPLSPAYDNRSMFASAMPVAKGTIPFYEELLAKGYGARLLNSPQNGHGWAKFGTKDFEGNDVCTKSRPDFAIDPAMESLFDLSELSDYYALTYFTKRLFHLPAPSYQHFRFASNGKYVNEGDPIDVVLGNPTPDVDDQGDLYEQIGTSEDKFRNVLDIDPTAIGLDPSTHLFVNGFDYGDDPENELGPLVVTEGFRYEPVQTEFELGATPSEVVEKYGLPTPPPVATPKPPKPPSRPSNPL